MKKINYKILFETFLKKGGSYQISKVCGMYVMEKTNFCCSWVYHLGTNKKTAIKRMQEVFLKGI